MRTTTAILLALFAMVSPGPAGAAPPGGAGGGNPAAPALPGTLDRWYPPAADGPVYLFRMLDLDAYFSGIVVDLMENDWEGARGSFEGFEARYRETAGLVPEWKEAYPENPVRELGRALAEGDRERAMGAFAAVGEGCHRCHLRTMVPVQQKYHWGDFGALSVQDPVSGAATGYPRFKQFLSANLAGIAGNLRQGQTDNARKQFEGFRARFRALADSCGGCHEQPSRYFVDRDVLEAVDGIGEAFSKQDVSAEAVTSLARKIGRESCSKCHLVHLPAAMAKAAAR